MSLQQIVIEVILIVVLQALGSSFWECVKYYRLRHVLLTNFELLQSTVSAEDKSVLDQESRKMQPSGKSPAEAMEAALADGGKIQNKRMLLLCVPIIAIVAGSYYMGTTFVSINASVFFILALFPVTQVVRTKVFADLLKISLVLYRWNREDAEACKRFCVEERPVFKNLHKVMTEL
jgi:hypothetical protein